MTKKSFYRTFCHTYSHLKGQRKGYRGEICLLNPNQEIIKIRISPRLSEFGWDSAIIKGEKFPGTRKKDIKKRFPYKITRSYSKDHSKYNSQELQPYLAKGFKVISSAEYEKLSEEKKKNTNKIIGTTKTGDKSHGGDNASREVENSPNSANDGKKNNKKRGGKKWKNKNSQPQGEIKKPVAVDEFLLKSKSSAYLKSYDAKHLVDVRKTVEILKNLLGVSDDSIQSGTSVDIESLLIALETGDNPIPYFDIPKEIKKSKLFISPDISGSCCGWSDVSVSWANQLSKIDELDVFHLTNCNGYFNHYVDQNTTINNDEVEKLLHKFDYVIYLGDYDGFELCNKYASFGVKVIALSSVNCNNMNPRVLKSNDCHKNLTWIDGVKAKNSEDWYKALKLVNWG